MDLTAVTVDLGQYFVLATTIITALVGLIAVRKIVKLTNRT